MPGLLHHRFCVYLGPLAVEPSCIQLRPRVVRLLRRPRFVYSASCAVEKTCAFLHAHSHASFGFRSSSSPPWSLARDRCRDRSRDRCKNPRAVGTVEKDFLILQPYLTVPAVLGFLQRSLERSLQQSLDRDLGTKRNAGEALVSSTRHRVLHPCGLHVDTKGS